MKLNNDVSITKPTIEFLEPKSEGKMAKLKAITNKNLATDKYKE